jgi:hypothetical protein
MNFQIDVTSTLPSNQVAPPGGTTTPVEVLDLLKQMLEVQREQLAYQRAAAAAHDAVGRWRAFLTRWSDEFPTLSNGCKKSMPHLERCYAKLIDELNDRLSDADNDAIDNDFSLQEFLDRYGMRLAQLGTILNLVGPLAEAGAEKENEATS